MSARSNPLSAEIRSFAVGGRVYVHIGKQKRVARIVEDRGTIGRGGRRLLRVTFSADDDPVEQSFEIPAADVTPAEAKTPTRGKSRAKVAHTSPRSD